MAQVTLPYTLTPGTPENVNNLMSNLTALRDGVNTIDTAQIANGAITAQKLASGVGGVTDGSVTADKLAAALANNVGANQTGVTNRSAMTAMTTERTTSAAGGITTTDVTGASLSFTVTSGAYVIVGWNCQLKASGSPGAFVKVLASSCIANATKTIMESSAFLTASGSTEATSYQKIGGLAMFSAAEIGTGSQTFKFQFGTSQFATAYVDECYLTVTQVTF